MKNNTGFLRVPVRLQALCLDGEQDIVRAMADYRRLPADIDGALLHRRTPNLGEHILAPPFARGLMLPAGIHLHWLLPDALGQGDQSEEEELFRFPRVPNRWLVLRSGGGLSEKQWVVESDYLYPEGAGDEFESEAEAPANIPVLPDPAPGPGHRFRFLGRALPLDQWRQAPGSPDNEYLPALTAVGQETELRVIDPVRASFAAFYPNCRSVFGLHDDDPALHTRTPPAGLRYDVLGWYTDAEHDCLTPLLAEARTPGELQTLLEERLEWKFTPEDPATGPVPAATLLHARLGFSPGVRADRNRVGELARPTVAVGRTETEALAAHLAHRHSPEPTPGDIHARQIMEEQLEALQLTERLDGHELNLEDILEEARHERGFAAIQGGIRWAVHPKSDDGDGDGDLFAMFRQKTPRLRQAPPPAWAGLLDTLNARQEEYQRAVDALEDLRQRMYHRWYALMPSKGVGVNFFEAYVAPVRRQITAMGLASLEQNAQNAQEGGGGRFRVATWPARFEVVSLRSTYLGYYLDVINKGEPFVVDEDTRDDGSYETWGIEFPNCCGFHLDPSHTVTVLEHDQAWEIHDRGITYPVRRGETGLFLEVPAADSAIAVRLGAALDAAQDAVAAYNASEAGAASPYVLRAVPEEPFYEPADPVVLFTGEAVSGDIWQADDLLPCQLAILPLDLATLPEATLAALQGYLGGLGPEAGRTWSQPSWNPFMMHWSLHVAACGRDDNGDFDPDLLLEHYELGIQGIDQRLKEGHESAFSATNDTYLGMSLLSPSAGREVTERILLWLETELLPDYYAETEVPPGDQGDGYLAEHFAEVKAWYLATNPGAGVNDPVYTALWSYQELQETSLLAQSLGNFHDALLLREPTLQLPIADPTALPSSIHFFVTETVRDAMGDSVQRRPLLLDRFNPLRAGALAIEGLWLVDTFGQHKEVIALSGSDDVQVITTTDQEPPGALYHVSLPPRLAQPARLRFEWLPADPGGGRRSSEHPGTNPICGFLLVNSLDGALAVYDATGNALGSVDRGNTWRTAPETGTRVAVSAQGRPQLPDPHLQKVVDYTMDRGGDFLATFLSTQRTALDAIDPEAFAENPSRALLIARPVAVVRASLALEVKGPPASDPSSLTDTGEGTDRALSALRVPLRLGEYQQLDDGVVGFWREDDDGAFAGGVFYSPQLRGVSHSDIRTYADGDDALQMRYLPTGPAQRVTLLLDPRGQAHATTGVLPSPQLRIHPDHYSQALRDMEVSFLTGPFLSDRGELRVDVPHEPGYAWSWVTQEPGGAWAETDELFPPNPRAAFSAPQELREGWLILRRKDSASEG